MDKIKEFFIGKAGDRKKEREIVRETEKMEHPPAASYTNPNAPLTFAEMRLLVPREIWNPKHPKHNAVFGLLRSMERFLEDSRMVSKRPVDAHKYYSGKEIKIRCIQEQMGAIRFRLDSSDYANVLEMGILKNRLYELYQVAKEVDPEGTARYERHIDKQMRKARARA